MAEKKALVFDAGAIINFSMNGILDLFPKLKKLFDGKFLVTEEVKSEIITRPLGIKKFELGALKIKKLIDEKVFELPSSLGIRDSEIYEGTNRILEIANHLFSVNSRHLRIIDKGEASCMVLSEILTKGGIENMVVIDERTTRMLCEKPENQLKLLETKLHTRVKAKKELFGYFKKFKVIRSTELAFIAYKNKLVDLRNGQVLDALLYALKYRGCSISNKEIEEMKKL